MALGVLVGAGVLIYFLLGHLPRELSPIEDRARLWVRARAPDGVSYDYMQNVMNEPSAATAERLPGSRDHDDAGSSGGGQGMQMPVNNAFARVFPEGHRETANASQAQLAEELRTLQRQFPELRLNITQEASIGEKRANETGLQLVLEAPELDDLRDGLPKFRRDAQESWYSASSTATSSSANRRCGCGSTATRRRHWRKRTRHRADAADLAQRPACSDSSSTRASSTT